MIGIIALVKTRPARIENRVRETGVLALFKRFDLFASGGFVCRRRVNTRTVVRLGEYFLIKKQVR